MNEIKTIKQIIADSKSIPIKSFRKDLTDRDRIVIRAIKNGATGHPFEKFINSKRKKNGKS